MICSHRLAAVFGVLITILVATGARAQVGQGLLDANSAPEQALGALPHMTPAIVQAMVAQRPFASVTQLHTCLLYTSPSPRDS